ncbi:hypothetical protein LDENG_00266080, partial [Lucifuga dentata]
MTRTVSTSCFTRPAAIRAPHLPRSMYMLKRTTVQQGVELAVSIFWPNYYQVVFEAVSTGQRGLLAIKDITLQGHQC